MTQSTSFLRVVRFAKLIQFYATRPDLFVLQPLPDQDCLLLPLKEGKLQPRSNDG